MCEFMNQFVSVTPRVEDAGDRRKGGDCQTITTEGISKDIDG